MRTYNLTPVTLGSKKEPSPHNVRDVCTELTDGSDRPIEHQPRLRVRVTRMLNNPTLERCRGANGNHAPVPNSARVASLPAESSNIR